MLIVTHTDLPSKMLKGLVFVFVALLIGPVHREAMKETLFLNVGGIEAVLEVGGVAQHFSTPLRPAAGPCFSSVVVQISFH